MSADEETIDTMLPGAVTPAPGDNTEGEGEFMSSTLTCWQRVCVRVCACVWVIVCSQSAILILNRCDGFSWPRHRGPATIASPTGVRSH